MSGGDGRKIVDEKTIAREIFGEPGAHSGTNTCGGGIDYEARKKILRGLGIYFLVALPILFVLPPILVYFHLISKATVELISALWIALYLANTVGATGYLLEVRDCWDMYYCDVDLVDKAELIFALYLILCIIFFLIEPLVFSSI